MQYANKCWNEEVIGSGSHIERGKGLMFKAPHHKTDIEVAGKLAKVTK